MLWVEVYVAASAERAKRKKLAAVRRAGRIKKMGVRKSLIRVPSRVLPI
jgi:hypothetical protein